MSQLYNPYIGQVSGQQPATPQTWLPNNPNWESLRRKQPSRLLTSSTFLTNI